MEELRKVADCVYRQESNLHNSSCNTGTVIFAGGLCIWQQLCSVYWENLLCTRENHSLIELIVYMWLMACVHVAYGLCTCGLWLVRVRVSATAYSMPIHRSCSVSLAVMSSSLYRLHVHVFCLCDSTATCTDVYYSSRRWDVYTCRSYG